MTSLGADSKGVRLQCSAHRESRVCKNGRTYYRDDIERRALSGLKERLADRKYLADYILEYNDEYAQRWRVARHKAGDTYASQGESSAN